MEETPYEATFMVAREENFSFRTDNHQYVMRDNALSIDGQLIDERNSEMIADVCIAWAMLSGKLKCPCCGDPIVITSDEIEHNIFGGGTRQ